MVKEKIRDSDRNRKINEQRDTYTNKKTKKHTKREVHKYFQDISKTLHKTKLIL